MRLFYILLLSVFLLPTTNHAQTEGEEEQGNSRVFQVGDRTYVYKNRGGNIGLYIGKEGTLVIDTQFAEVTEDLLKVIGRFSDKPIKYVLNTHHHGDHVGGNGNLSNVGATIISHDNVRTTLMNNLENSDEKGDDSTFPDITLSDELTFHFGREEITAFHLEKAHTNGDLIVHFKENNILHTGDAFVNGRYPFVDVDNGGTFDGYFEGLEKILRVCDKDTKIIPGHGEVANRKDVDRLRELLKYTAKRISFHVYNDVPKEQIIAMTDLTAEYDRLGYGDHFVTREQFLEMVYNSVAREYLEQQRDREERARMIEEIRQRQARDKKNAEEDERDKGGR